MRSMTNTYELQVDKSRKLGFKKEFEKQFSYGNDAPTELQEFIIKNLGI